MDPSYTRSESRGVDIRMQREKQLSNEYIIHIIYISVCIYIFICICDILFKYVTVYMCIYIYIYINKRMESCKCYIIYIYVCVCVVYAEQDTNRSQGIVFHNRFYYHLDIIQSDHFAETIP